LWTFAGRKGNDKAMNVVVVLLKIAFCCLLLLSYTFLYFAGMQVATEDVQKSNTKIYEDCKGNIGVLNKMLSEQMESVLKEKNQLVIKLVCRRLLMLSDEIRETNLRIAALEEQIANYELGQGRVEEACVNLVSQATALEHAGIYDKAIAVYQSVSEKTEKDGLKNFVLSEIERIKSVTVNR
jgi:hypothetical protein